MFGLPCRGLPCDVNVPAHGTVGDLGDVELPAGRRVQLVVALAGYLTNLDADGRFKFELGSPLERLEKAGGEGFNRRPIRIRV